MQKHFILFLAMVVLLPVAKLAADSALPATPAPNISALRAQADANNAAAQNDLGEAYEKGLGVETSYVEAFRLYRKAAAQGNAKAEANLGTFYERGLVIALNYPEAMRLYKLSAAHGNVEAKARMGRMYEYGRGVTQDFAQAMRLCSEASEQGSSLGSACVGWMYTKGHGVDKADYKEAMQWFQKAIERGDSWGLGSAGIANTFLTGWGVNENVNRRGGLTWATKAAELGDSTSPVWIARLYLKGKGGVSKDEKEGVRWLKKAAERGDVEGQLLLGQLYEAGTGVERDYAASARWYKAALSRADGEPALRKEVTGKIESLGGRANLGVGLDPLFVPAEQASAAQPLPSANPGQGTNPVAGANAGGAKAHIVSTPDGAEITVDGKFIGSTPSDVTLSLGEHQIKVSLGGHEWSRSMLITPGIINIRADLGGSAQPVQASLPQAPPPDAYNTLLGAAVAHWNNKQVSEAQQDVARLIGSDPNRWEGYAIAGKIEQALGKLPEAKLAYEQAMALAPAEAKGTIANVLQQINAKLAQ